MHDSTNAEVAQAASALWSEFTPAERRLIPFGLFPGDKMKAHADISVRQLAVALMKIAEEGQS